MNEKRIAKIQKIKQWFQHIKSTKRCAFCGEARTACLDFHHVIPRRRRGGSNGKKLTISRMVILGKNRNAIMEEIKKCIILCSNCHIIEELKYLPKQHKSEKRKWLDQQKTARGTCGCGENRLEVLQWHHTDQTTKQFNVGQSIKLRKSKEEILEEINKCILQCSNCHRVLHNQ